VKSLYVLTENQTKFIWTEQCQEAFDKLKQTLTATKGKLILDMDTSGHGISGVVPEIERNREGHCF